MSDLEFIDKLSKDLPPVNPVNETRVSLSLLFIFGLSMLLFILVLSINPGWAPEPLFIITSIGLALLMLASVHCAVRSCLPGRSYAKWALNTIWVSAGLVGIGLVLGMFSGLTPSEHMHLGLSLGGLKCTIAMLGFSLIPFVATAWALYKLAPTEYRKTAKWLGIAAGTCGAIGIGLHCSLHEPLHWAAWHLAPTILIVGAAFLVSRKWFRW